MYAQPQRGVQLRETGKQHRSTVPGIHLKIEEDFQVVEDGIVDVICFVNNNNRRFLLFYGKACNFFLNAPEIIRLAETGLCAQLFGQIAVKVVYRERREAGVNRFVEGWVQFARNRMKKPSISDDTAGLSQGNPS